MHEATDGSCPGECIVQVARFVHCKVALFVSRGTRRLGLFFVQLYGLQVDPVLGADFLLRSLDVSLYEVWKVVSSELRTVVSVPAVAIVNAEEGIVGAVVELCGDAVAVLIRFVFVCRRE